MKNIINYNGKSPKFEMNDKILQYLKQMFAKSVDNHFSLLYNLAVEVKKGKYI